MGWVVLCLGPRRTYVIVVHYTLYMICMEEKQTNTGFTAINVM